MRGWAGYFRHAVCKHTLSKPAGMDVTLDYGTILEEL
ncbi:MAG TPA: hypothetical protein DHU96_12125 [Actinobacteria bacterium]|nr:hypothetical protein [Actinomycetota bacterium]